MATTDYTGRTVDLLFTDNWKEMGQFSIVNSISNSPDVCTGVQKVAQTFAIMLLTKKGSVKSAPTFGTGFVAGIEAGVNNELVFSSLFNAAVSDIKNYLKLNTPATTPSDERFASATLDALSLGGGAVNMVVSILTAAGSSRQIVIPVGVAIK